MEQVKGGDFETSELTFLGTAAMDRHAVEEWHIGIESCHFKG